MSEAMLIPRVLHILLSPAAQKIDFWAHGMHVSGGGYGMVLYYIGKDWIKPRLIHSTSQIPSFAEAMYVPGSHILWFRTGIYGSSPEERAVILHECTHALRDIMGSPAFGDEGMYGSKIGGQLHSDNEAAAYIAESLFYIYDNGVQRQVGDGDGADVYLTANRIASKLKDNKGATVEDSEFKKLSGIIGNNPHFQGEGLPNRPDERLGNW